MIYVGSIQIYSKTEWGSPHQIEKDMFLDIFNMRTNLFKVSQIFFLIGYHKLESETKTTTCTLAFSLQFSCVHL